MKRILIVSSSIDKNILSESILKKISFYTKSKQKVLWRNVASEFPLSSDFDSSQYKNLKSLFKDKKIDFNIITLKHNEPRKKKLLVADMDSTIISSETLDDLAIVIGKAEEIKTITNDAMSGKIDFIESLQRRVKVLSGTKIEVLDLIKNKISYTLGAKELISTMNNNNSVCILCTGGFHYIADKVKKDIGFKHIQANTIEIQNGIITGQVLEPIYNENSKLEFMKSISKKYNILQDETCAVGDGANDIKVIKNASFGVSFMGKEILNKEAEIIIKYSDLTTLLFIQGYTKKEITRY